MASHAAWQWMIRGLFGLGAACFLWCVGVALYAASYQRKAEILLAQAPSARGSAGQRDKAEIPDPVRGTVIGRLRIPRLNLSTVVVQGDDEATLMAGVGHLPDTTLPWKGGNTALAGHRDTFFRALQAVRVGDRITFGTIRGDYNYRVRDRRIVNPSDLSVLKPTNDATLTLITCYPFSYIGHAPQRFIVQADRITDERGEGPVANLRN